ncbi:MAG: polyamine aminopropyltransferase [Haliangiales bacterium]
MNATALSARKLSVLVVATFVAGLCSILYELLIGTVSSYFLGDSVRQFSLTIGLFMAAMGVGSFLARRLDEQVLRRFVAVEIGLGLIGGVSVPALYAVFGYTTFYYPAMLIFIVIIGTLTGLEIPMLVLVSRRLFTLEVNLSNILSLDYLGALAATLLFPFVLLPGLGTFRSALVGGAINLVVALLVLYTFRAQFSVAARWRYGVVAKLGLVALAAGFVFAPQLLEPWHSAMYRDRVIFNQQTPYQQIALTRSRDDVRLYLNGGLQFSSVDEYVYHEALVHPALALAPHRASVLLLGAGDGLAVRDILAYEDVEQVTVVDLDPEMTRLGLEHPLLRRFNRDSLHDPRVRIINRDAFTFLDEHMGFYDLIIADLPDPTNVSLARLYSREFYTLVARRLARTGILVTQATSPFFAKDAFWCIHDTVAAAGFRVWPYHAYVPSFGDWGFVMAARVELAPAEAELTLPTRSLEGDALAEMFSFSREQLPSRECVSTLDSPAVLSAYLDGWKSWY